MIIPASMRPEEDVTLGHFTVTIIGKGEPQIKQHAIKFMHHYGFLCSSLMTTNGNLHLITSYIHQRAANAIQMAGEYDCDSVDYTLTLLDDTGFQAVDITAHSEDQLKCLFLASAEILRLKQIVPLVVPDQAIQEQRA